jgi:tetratricopeptide (TPR) repeat protein
MVMNYLGAIALVEKKENAKPADYFSRALKLGSEDSATYFNLATALHNMGRSQEAESVLERGIAAYPNSGQLVARLAIDYSIDGQGWRPRSIIKNYRKLFPEDTHWQVGWSWNGKEVTPLKPEFESKTGASESQLRLGNRNRYVLNPGSVGQPRDGDWRAAFAVYDDTEAILTWYRVPYRVRTAQRRILQAELPETLATRLRDGT